jgi:hypothetical protein
MGRCIPAFVGRIDDRQISEGTMNMPFGKYAGRPIKDLPDGYLQWLSKRDISCGLRAAVDDEVRNRSGRNHDGSGHRYQSQDQRSDDRAHGVSISIPADHLALVNDIVHEGFRALAKKQHPDAGGDTRQMQILNGVANLLRSQLNSAGGVR